MTGFPMDAGAAREASRTSARVVARVQGPTDPVVPPFVDLFPTMQHKPYNTPRPRHPRPRRRAGARWTATTSPCMKQPRRHRRPARATASSCSTQLDALPPRRPTRPTRRHGHVYHAGLRRADVEQAGRGPGRDRRSRSGPRPLRPRLAEAPGRRRPDVERPAPDGPPAGRGRGARASPWPTASGTRTATTSATCKQHLPLFDQGISALVEDIYARGLDQDVTVVRLGRVRPDAEDQQGRRPRPLGAGELRRSWPAAG